MVRHNADPWHVLRDSILLVLRYHCRVICHWLLLLKRSSYYQQCARGHSPLFSFGLHGRKLSTDKGRAPTSEGPNQSALKIHSNMSNNVYQSPAQEEKDTALVKRSIFRALRLSSCESLLCYIDTADHLYKAKFAWLPATPFIRQRSLGGLNISAQDSALDKPEEDSHVSAPTKTSGMKTQTFPVPPGSVLLSCSRNDDSCGLSK
jgi:hypothetical protein